MKLKNCEACDFFTHSVFEYAFEQDKTENEIISEALYNPINSDRLKNIVHEPDRNIVGAVSENYVTAHESGRELVDSMDGVNIKKKSDIVIASVGRAPKDINLYQSIKTY